MDTYDNSINSVDDLKRIREECLDWVKDRARISAGTSIVPIPFFDVAADVVSLSNLLPKISQKFQLEVDDESVEVAGETINLKTLVNRGMEYAGFAATRVAAKRVYTGFAGRTITKQIAKFVPFSGQLIAGGIGYMTMNKVATDHVNSCYKQAIKQLSSKS